MRAVAAAVVAAIEDGVEIAAAEGVVVAAVEVTQDQRKLV
jgi:serine protease inhibitor